MLGSIWRAPAVRTGLVVCTFAWLLGVTSDGVAQAAEAAGSFSRGQSRFSIVLGNGYAFNESYLVAGVGAAYFLTNGLNVGLDVEWWTAGDPTIVKVSPSVQYIFYQIPRVSPYLGAFYRRSYIENRENLDSLGGRAGVYIAAGRNAHLGLGIVHESYLDCDESKFDSCEETYPEVSFTVAF